MSIKTKCLFGILSFLLWQTPSYGARVDRDEYLDDISCADRYYEEVRLEDANGEYPSGKAGVRLSVVCYLNRGDIDKAKKYIDIGIREFNDAYSAFVLGRLIHTDNTLKPLDNIRHSEVVDGAIELYTLANRLNTVNPDPNSTDALLEDGHTLLLRIPYTLTQVFFHRFLLQESDQFSYLQKQSLDKLKQAGISMEDIKKNPNRLIYPSLSFYPALRESTNTKGTLYSLRELKKRAQQCVNVPYRPSWEKVNPKSEELYSRVIKVCKLYLAFAEGAIEHEKQKKEHVKSCDDFTIYKNHTNKACAIHRNASVEIRRKIANVQHIIDSIVIADRYSWILDGSSEMHEIGW